MTTDCGNDSPVGVASHPSRTGTGRNNGVRDRPWTITILFFALLALWTGQAAGGCGATREELPELPPWCAHIMPDTGARNVHYKPGLRQFGHLWLHIHHYCWALNCINRARKSKMALPQYKEYSDPPEHYLGVAVSDFLYVIGHNLGPDDSVAPELYFKLGQTYQQLGQAGEAAKAYTRATLYDPRYVPAYIAHSDLFKGLGDKADAMAVLKQALKYVPDSKSIDAALKDLGP
jgi:tetratricopeptide (TPR) repeat protein